MSNQINFASASVRASAAIVFTLLLSGIHSPGFPHEPEGPAYSCLTDGAEDQDQSPTRCLLRAEVERLKPIQRRHEDRIMAIEGVNGMGIGADKGQRRAFFVILVDQSSPLPQLPRSIENVEVRVEKRAPVRLLDGAPTCGPCHRERFPPPVKMGNSGGLERDPGGGCTLGFKACDLSTGLIVFVTNSHCNDISPAPACSLVTPGWYSEWVHPGRFEQMETPYQIGDVAGHAAPSCSANNNLTDATKVTSPNTLTSWAIRDVPFYPSFTPGDPLPGDQVRKSGRTTGLTRGTVHLANITRDVPGPDGGFCCGPLTMKQQIEWLPDYPLVDGDSGSALLSDSPGSTSPAIVGLNFGQGGVYAYANRIENVLSALNISLHPWECLYDCLYSRAARTLSSADASNSSYTPTNLIELGHRFRGQVLQRSEIGRQFIGHFYQFSDEAIALAARSPGLLERTARMLVTIAPSVRELVESGEARVPLAHIRAVDQLLAAYQPGASGELQEAIRTTRTHLKSPKALRSLGILPDSREKSAY